MGALAKGAKGSSVKTLQKRLNELGAKPKLKIDGIFGPLTEGALIAFQKKAGVKPPNGKVGNTTEMALKVGGKVPEWPHPDVKKRAEKTMKIATEEMVKAIRLELKLNETKDKEMIKKAKDLRKQLNKIDPLQASYDSAAKDIGLSKVFFESELSDGKIDKAKEQVKAAARSLKHMDQSEKPLLTSAADLAHLTVQYDDDLYERNNSD
ncbi:MAG: peptidoglycan-binding protein [Pseudomonadota bacterium]